MHININAMVWAHRYCSEPERAQDTTSYVLLDPHLLAAGGSTGPLKGY